MNTTQVSSFEGSLEVIAEEDIEALIESRIHYGDSWRAEGGFSAFFNIKRKIDRFVRLLGREQKTVVDENTSAVHNRERYNVFSHIIADLMEGGETTLDTIRDMRRYLMLTEAWFLQQGLNLPPSRDNISANNRKVKEEVAVANQICADQYEDVAFGFSKDLDL